MRIERITIDLCVADCVTREDVVESINGAILESVLAIEVVGWKPEEKPAEPPKQKRKYTKRSKKWTASNSQPEKTDGSVKRTVRTNANGETETVRDGEHEGEKIIFRK